MVGEDRTIRLGRACELFLFSIAQLDLLSFRNGVESADEHTHVLFTFVNLASEELLALMEVESNCERSQRD